jgi:hypothetical protein
MDYHNKDSRVYGKRWEKEHIESIDYTEAEPKQTSDAVEDALSLAFVNGLKPFYQEIKERKQELSDLGLEELLPEDTRVRLHPSGIIEVSSIAKRKGVYYHSLSELKEELGGSTDIYLAIEAAYEEKFGADFTPSRPKRTHPLKRVVVKKLDRENA